MLLSYILPKKIDTVVTDTSIGTTITNPVDCQLVVTQNDHQLNVYNSTSHTWEKVGTALNTDDVVLIDGSNAFTGTISGVAPTQDAHLTTKSYVDSVAIGLDIKASCNAATVEALSATYNNNVLTASSNGAISIDDVSLAVNDRVLVKNQGTGSQNGIYKVTTVGDGSNPYVLTRSSDYDGTPSGETTTGAFCLIIAGTTNLGTGWVLTTADPITVGTTSLTYVQFSGNSSGGSTAWNVVTVTSATYNMTNTNDVILADATSNSVAVTLPDPTTATKKPLNIKRIDSSTNSVSINPKNTETMDGEAIKYLYSQYDSLTFVTNGTNWYII